MNMTPQAKETLDDILQQFKAGNITQDGASGRIADLFQREPVNYKRHYSGSAESAPDKLVAAIPQKGQIISLYGFGAADRTSFKVLDVTQEQPGASIYLELEAQA